MTFIGKVLAILNLLAGLAIVTWSASVYYQRPGWFDPIPEGGVDKGHEPRNFAMLKKEAESLARVANRASGEWGANLKILEDLELRRDSRRKVYAERLAWAHKGNAKDNGNAFYAPVWEKDANGKDTSFLDTTKLGVAIKGPDDVPLKGVDTLLTNFSDDVKQVVTLSEKIDKHRLDYAEKSKQILIEEARLVKMIEIRDAVQSELFYLASFELNVYETRETVLRRQKQLVWRLRELGGGK